MITEERRRISLALSLLQHGGEPERARDEAVLALQGATITEILRLRERRAA